MIPPLVVTPGFGFHPLFERLAIASIEFALIVALVHLLIVVLRLRCPRVICFLWLAVLVKPLLSITVGSPLAVPLFDAPPAPEPAVVAAAVAESRSLNTPSVPALPDLPPTTQVAGGAKPQPIPPPGGEPAPRPAPLPIRSAQPEPSSAPSEVLAWAVILVWLAGAGACLVRYLFTLLRLRSIIGAAHGPVPALDATYRDMARHLGIKRPPQILISGRIESPALVGVIRPVILLPRWYTSKCDDAQINWSLRHELIHWRWLDSLSIFIRDIARIAFWFHPAAWWGARRLTESLETACDQALVHSYGQASEYAEYLFEILRAIRDRRRTGLAGGLFVTRTQIGRRIAALLDGSVTSAPRLTARSLACMILLSATLFAVGATVRRPTGLRRPGRESLASRTVRFPRNRSLGYCTFVRREAKGNDFFSEALSTTEGSNDPAPEDARGTLVLPAAKSLRLAVTPDTFRIDRPFSSLKPDDIQIITFQYCSRPRARELEAMSDLSGLIALDLCSRSDHLKTDPPLDRATIQHLAGLKHLQALSLPSTISPEALEALSALPSLTSLQIKAPQDPSLPNPSLTDAQFAAIGGLPSLAHLSIVGDRPGTAAGLAHLGRLRSLKSLQLIGDMNPELNQHLRHIGALASLEELSFSKSAVNDEGLAHLASLKALRQLNLDGTAIGDRGLVHLAKLAHLEELNLWDTRIGDAGMKHLEGLRQIRKLSLQGTDVGAAGLASLSRLTRLEELWVPNRAMTDQGFAALAKLKSLKNLGPFTSMELTDAGLRSLPDMTALEALHIRAPRLTDTAMPYIARCGSLRELALSAGISDAGLAELGRLKGLRELTLHNMSLKGPGLGAVGQLPHLAKLNLIGLTLEPGGLRNLQVPATVQYLRLYIKPGVADDDLAILTGLHNLRYFFINAPGLTDGGMKYLAGLESIENLSISGTNPQITDASLQALEHLPTLQSLIVRGTGVSEQGLHQLSEKLPGVNISPRFRFIPGLSLQTP